MSWLSHFTNWVGEKSKTILPIVTGVAGFAAGMIPGIGGTVSKAIDKLGSKISGGVETLGVVNDLVGSGGGGGTPPADSPASPTSAAVQAVADKPNPLQTVADIVTSSQKDSPRTKPAEPTKTNPLVWGALALGAALAFGGGGRRR